MTDLKGSEITVRTHQLNIFICTKNILFLRFRKHEIRNILNFDFIKLIPQAPCILILKLPLDRTDKLTIHKEDGRYYQNVFTDTFVEDVRFMEELSILLDSYFGWFNM